MKTGIEQAARDKIVIAKGLGLGVKLSPETVVEVANAIIELEAVPEQRSYAQRVLDFVRDESGEAL